MHENKQLICDALAVAIRLTRGGEDLHQLIYDGDTAGEETVTAWFRNGSFREINVAADSGFAMIKDIVNHFGI